MSTTTETRHESQLACNRSNDDPREGMGALFWMITASGVVLIGILLLAAFTIRSA